MGKSKIATKALLKFCFTGLAIFLAPQNTSAAEISELTGEIRSNRLMEDKAGTEFGDSIDYQNGRFGLAQDDIVLPGIGPEIRIGRRFNYVFRYPSGVSSQTLDWVSTGTAADWSLELPRMSVRLPLAQYASGQMPAGATLFPRAEWNVTGSDAHARCTNFTNIPSLVFHAANTYTVPASDWWTGLSLIVPGQSTQTVLKRDATATALPTHLVTNQNWMISCLPALKNGQPGEGFLAISPMGTKYWFDWLTFQNYEWISTYSGATSLLFRSVEATMQVTRIEDAHGNWINYEYEDHYPISITASDGRRISLDWTTRGWGDGSILYGQGPFRHISSISVQPESQNPQIWRYEYELETYGKYWRRDAHLRKVIRPDGSAWTFNLDKLVKGCYGLDSTGSLAFPCGHPQGKNMDSSIASPSGATVSYSFYLSERKRLAPPINSNPHWRYDSEVGVTLGLAKKIISGPSIDQTWTYSYTPALGAQTNQTASQYVSTTIRKPDQTSIRYTVNNVYQDRLEGRVTKVEVLNAAGEVMREELYEYADQTLGPYPQKVGSSMIGHSGTAQLETYMPIRKRTTNQQGDAYVNFINSFDVFGRALSQTLNSAAHSKTNVAEYYDNPQKWIYGKTKSLTTNGITIQRIEYDAEAMPWKTYSFEKLQQTTTYNADGTISTIQDGRGNTTSFSSWKRGIPQQIQYPATPEAPAGATESAVINDHGWITSTTDGNGYTHGYGYDAMGRLASVVYPSGDNDAWVSKGFEFRPVTTSDWLPPGISIGQWRHYEGQGNYAKFTYFDAMWRPVLVQEYDTSNVAATLRYIRTNYDGNGRVSFQSYPVSDPASTTTGIRNFYDALDRVTSVEQDSEHGVLTTTTEYLAGLQIRVTNPRNLKTTTSYMAWDQPNYNLPIYGEYPENKVIGIVRDILGRPTELKQHSADNSLQASRKYVYDGEGQLCKTIEPETGASVMGYDAAGNLAWQVSGLPAASFNSTTDCQHTAAVGTGLSVTRTYDARNRLTHLTFPNGKGNQIWTYEKDNLPASVTAYNDTSNAAPVVTAYTYNKRRLLTGESLSQPSTYTWGIGYEYDTIGNLRWQSYPTGLKLDFAPNALGQATQARNANQSSIYYASGAEYFPNGALKQFTYGNGIVHTMSQNARQLPARVTSSGNVLDFAYDYDKNGNPTTILDLVTGTPTAQHRWMSYDGLDRLTTSASAMFGGNDHTHRFTYDALDNIESWKHAGVKDYADYVYDAQNRLISIRNTAGATVVGIGYDSQGNLANKNGQVYEFDYGNRLRKLPSKESYRYDGLGRRVQTTKEDGSKTTLWQYNQAGQMVFSSDWEGPTYLNQKTHESVYLGGSLIATIDHDWPSNAVIATKYQHTDALGSPVALTNEAGAVIERNNYEPYGAIIGNPTRSGIGYTGHVMDGATGLTYMQQRYYDQSIGRFLSVDPVTANSSTGAHFNRYWYADGNPYKFKDPDGRIVETAWDVANVAMDVTSLVGNVAAGNYLGAAVDGGGLIWDGFATAVPVLPGGAGAAIKTYRLSHVAHEGLRAAETAKALLSRALAVTKSNIGNFNIGRMARSHMDELGVAWVGKGARAITGKNGQIGLVSADGLKTYRFPQQKKNGVASGQIQGNLTEYVKGDDGKLRVLRNAHIDLLR